MAEIKSKRRFLSGLAQFCSSKPKTILTVWALSAFILFAASQNGASSLEGSDILIGGSSSERAIKLERDHFGESQSLAVLVLGDPKLINRYGPRVARRLNRIPKVSVLSPWSPDAPNFLRRKKNQALFVLQVRQPFNVVGKETVPVVKKKLNEALPESLRSHVTGDAALVAELNNVGLKAAKESEKIAAPILIIILLIVFRSPVAALLPILLGFAVIVCGNGAISLLSRFMGLDALATTMMSMMGLALGVDYSLLIVSKFREEQAKGNAFAVALERTVCTAGRTVIFAGAILIFALITALVITPGGTMVSAMTGALGATILAMVGSATLLPALFSLLAPYLERWHIGRKSPKARVGHIVKRLIKRPAVATAAVLVPLLILAVPAFGIEIGGLAPAGLPKDNPVRVDAEAFRKEAGGGWGAVFTVMVATERGQITEKKRLATLDKFQKKLARQDGIDTVLGPAALNKQSKKLQKAADDLSAQRKDLDKLENGLGDAEGGVGDLRNGLAEASSGAKSLEEGLSASLDGTLELKSALDETSSGSRELEGSIAEARDGAKKIASAAVEVEKGSVQVKDATKDFADELEGGRESLGSLQKASADATNELSLALTALDRTNAATKSDPEFAVAYERAATALATLTGQHPKTGQQVESGYYGMESSIARATEQNIAASKEANSLYGGANELHGGLVELSKGTDSLLQGLDEISAGSGSLASGLEETREGTGDLSAGNQTLVGGASSLKDGAGRLSGELGEGHTQSAALESGLDQMAGSVGQYNSGQGSAGTAEQQEKMAESGYFLLAGIDEGDKDEQEIAAFALNWDKGGTASRILVVPDIPNPGKGGVGAGPEVIKNLGRLNSNLNSMTPKLAKDLNASTGVGGRGAVITEFVNAMKSNVIPLLSTLILVALMVLTIIFRSPLLALKAVLLNLLTVAAAIGVLTLVTSGDSPLIGGPGYIGPATLNGLLAIIFAISIDYEVFLITRMREGYLRTGTTEGAIAYGIDHTARVITGAGAIMIGVFFAFSLSDYATMREFGVGLTVAVLLDATVVRLVLLPATMRLFGRANWWMPRWLDRLLPNVSIEGGSR